MRTPLCDLIGIDAPVVLAPMGGAVTPTLAAAVSNAGGLGLVPLSWTPPTEVAAVVEETRRLTERPFGANLGLAWDQRERLAVALGAGVRVISFFWGDAGGLIGDAHEAGAVVFVTVGTAAEGRAAAAAGADVIVAQGWEAGGHVWGTVSTIALVPRVVDAVGPSSGRRRRRIADGRGIAAVLALGAVGAWVGTRFLAATEAAIHPNYRRRILAAGEGDTFYETLFDRGWPDAPHRTLRNSTTHAWERAGRPASLRQLRPISPPPDVSRRRTLTATSGVPSPSRREEDGFCEPGHGRWPERAGGELDNERARVREAVGFPADGASGFAWERGEA